MHNYGCITLGILINLPVAYGVYLVLDGGSFLQISGAITLVVLILSLAISETDDMFKVEVMLPEYPRLREDEAKKEVARILKENGLR